jgi:hypothetical protein
LHLWEFTSPLTNGASPSAWNTFVSFFRWLLWLARSQLSTPPTQEVLFDSPIPVGPALVCHRFLAALAPCLLLLSQLSCCVTYLLCHRVLSPVSSSKADCAPFICPPNASQSTWVWGQHLLCGHPSYFKEGDFLVLLPIKPDTGLILLSLTMIFRGSMCQHFFSFISHLGYTI